MRGIQVWILDVSAIPQTKQIVLFAAAKGQFESSDNLVYGLGKIRFSRIRLESHLYIYGNLSILF